jgi:hypothetical protein
MKEELKFTNIGNKESQKELITEIMELDAKDGLYDHIGDTNEMVNDTVSYTVKELIEHGKQLEAKAKQTLYTEEEVRKAIGIARNGMSKNAYTIISTEDEIIKSLKQNFPL